MSEAERVADEIIEKYSPYCEGNDYDLGAERKENTKQCALIHVEGIIREINKYSHTDLADIQQWQEVKTIIENK